MWMLWDPFSVKLIWIKSFQCWKIYCLSLLSAFPSPHLTHTLIFFPSCQSSPLLLHTLTFLTKATLNISHCRSYKFTHIHKTQTLILRKRQAWNIEPNPYFYISWLVLSFPQMLSCLHDWLIGSIAVKMEYWCSAFIFALSWIKRKLVTVMVLIQREEFLRDLRDVFLVRESDQGEQFWSIMTQSKGLIGVMPGPQLVLI